MQKNKKRKRKQKKEKAKEGEGGVEPPSTTNAGVEIHPIEMKIQPLHPAPLRGCQVELHPHSALYS